MENPDPQRWQGLPRAVTPALSVTDEVVHNCGWSRWPQMSAPVDCILLWFSLEMLDTLWVFRHGFLYSWGKKNILGWLPVAVFFFVAHLWRRSRNLLWFCVTFWTNEWNLSVGGEALHVTVLAQVSDRGLHKLSSFGPWWPLSAHIQAPTLVAAIQPARRHRDGLLRCRHASMRKRLWHQFKWSGRPLLTEQVQRAEVEVEEEVVPACRSWSRTCTWLPARLPLAPRIPWPGYSERTWRNPPGHIEHSKMPRADGKSQKPKGRLGSVIPKHAALRCACSIVSASSANNRTGILRWSWEKKRVRLRGR